jgi:hypothetical protein
MRRFGIFGAAVALVVAFAVNGVCAQTATTEPVGKPLALLAGLRPPHEAKHKETKHAVRAKAEHKTTRKDAVRERHVRVATTHTRHVSVRKLAKRKYEHHEHAMTASAFAEESPQADSHPPAFPHWPTASSNSSPVEAAAGQTVAPVTDNARPGAETDSDPAASKVQTIKITASNPAGVTDPPAGTVASSATATNSSIATAPQSGPAASVQRSENKEPSSKTTDRVGSASWIAQVLAALGGAVTAGVVAWLLIAGRPVRTYG